MSGEIDKADGEKLQRKVLSMLGQLKRGFDVINDISEYKSTHINNENLFKSTIEILKMRGVNNIIRVVGNSKEALVQFANISKSIRNYNVKYIPTIEEAEKLLDCQS